MIQVFRTKKPAILTKNEKRWLGDYLAAKRDFLINPIPRNKVKLFNLEKKYNQYEIRAALKFMFSDKCSYCESHILHIDYGNIEHFRPKSIYPKSCFKWSNLLLACTICNGPNYKGNKFPTKKSGGPIINPAKENPDSFLNFNYDPETGVSFVLGKTIRGTKTCQLLGLNRPELVKHRNSIVRKMAFVAIQASKGDTEAAAEIKKCVNRDEEYSAFAKMLALKFNII